MLEALEHIRVKSVWRRKSQRVQYPPKEELDRHIMQVTALSLSEAVVGYLIFRT